MTLPEKTEKQIKALKKHYGWQKWEVLVHAVDREFEAMKGIKSIISSAAKGKKNETGRRGM